MRTTPLHINQQIHIALLISFASRNRTKDPHIVCAILRRRAQDILTLCLQQLIE